MSVPKGCTGINGEGELMGQPANPGSPGKMAVKTECVFVYSQKFIPSLAISCFTFSSFLFVATSQLSNMLLSDETFSFRLSL